MADILVADDEHSICQAFAEILRSEGHTAIIASSGREAVDRVEEAVPAMVFLDVQMPNLSGLEALRIIHERHPTLPVILMTAQGSIQTAMDAMSGGAFDYLGKPLDLAKIRQLVQRALHVPSTTVPNEAAPTTLPGEPIGKGPAMQQIFKMIGLLTSNKLTVLITGESGTGKELVARSIHQRGDQPNNPFVAINCAAIPEHLVESVLFGHEKGAFTDAQQQSIGRFEAAADGTLFLDEISELSYPLQSKLLRVLQEKSFERVGGNRSIPMRARVIAASNQNLETAIEQRRFRDDLYHRLNLIHLQMPPLRERREDIPLLAQYFLQQANDQLGKNLSGIEPKAMELLSAWRWPGNVRELEHCIIRSALVAPGTNLNAHDLALESVADNDTAAQPQDLELAVSQALAMHLHRTHASSEHGKPFPEIVQRVEQTLVADALRMTDGNQVAAATMLGINRTTLRKKLQATSPQ
jgi:nitrogen regulation protein NR(I)